MSAGWPARWDFIASWLLFIDLHGGMDFNDIRRISWIPMEISGRGFAACGALCDRTPALKDTFARFQLAAIKETFPRSQPAAISSISMDFRRFNGFPRISGIHSLPAPKNEMLPLKKPLLDPSWLLFHRFS